MKKTILKISFLCLVTVSSSVSMPVVDIPQVAENFQTIARWGEQIDQWKKEIDQWKQQYKAITEFKLKGNALEKFTQINNLLNEHGVSMGDLDLVNPKSQIGVAMAKLLDEYYLFEGFDECAYDFFTLDQKRICKDGLKREFQEMAAIKQLSDNANGILEKLNSLNTQLSEAEDMKTSQDITAAMESTMSSLELMTAQFDMMTIRNEAKEAIDARQQRQIYMQKFKNVKAFHDKVRIK